MRRTTLKAHLAEINHRGGAALRARQAAAWTALLADIRAGLMTHADEAQAMETRIDDGARRWVRRSPKMAQSAELLSDVVDLVHRIAGGRPLMPLLIDASDSEGALVRLLVLGRVLSAMRSVVTVGTLPGSPLSDAWALILDVIQER